MDICKTMYLLLFWKVVTWGGRVVFLSLVNNIASWKFMIFLHVSPYVKHITGHRLICRPWQLTKRNDSHIPSMKDHNCIEKKIISSLGKKKRMALHRFIAELIDVLMSFLMFKSKCGQSRHRTTTCHV